MQKKLTLMIDKDVYESLYKKIGRRKIGKYIEDMVRLHVMQSDLESAYAEMAKDREREKEAAEWAEIAFQDMADETR